MKWFKQRARKKKIKEWQKIAYKSSLFTAKILLGIILMTVLAMFIAVRYVQLEGNDSTTETYQDTKNYLLGF